MKTLILDNFDSFTYNLYQYIAELGGNPEVYRNNEITLDDIERKGYTHIVISPGPGSPDNKKDFGICGKVIEKFMGYIPILGVCLGHQGIIHELGGRIVRTTPMHGKRSLIRIKNSHSLFKGLPQTIEVMRYHSLIGDRSTLPKDLEIIGETEDRLPMAVCHKTLPLYGVQFHPESIGTPMGKEILKNFLMSLRAISMTAQEAEHFIDKIVNGEITNKEIEDVLLALARKGESIAEITGMARGLRKHAVKLPGAAELITMDTCGTGGSGLPRMNISTACAFVLASAGVKIAKHGNKAASGRCGSFDLLLAVGANIQLSPKQVAHAIEKIGIGFIFAPLFHPAMKKVAAVRKKLGVRTIFNLLGPLTNPAQPAFHLLGTLSVEIAEKLIAAMKNLGYRHAMVVTGEDGLDEVTLTGRTTVFELQKNAIRRFEFEPEALGIPRVKNFSEISGGSIEQNAQRFIELLQGKAKVALQNLLYVNCAFGFLVAQRVRNVKEGLALAKKTVTSDAAFKKFQEYKKFSSELRPA